MGFVTNNTGPNTGAFPAAIVPSQKKLALQQNYLDFTGSGNDFSQQYLPELYEQEVERYGNRTLSGFLRMVGAEMPMTSDQVVWSEQNRLHIAYDDVTPTNSAGVNGSARIAVDLTNSDASYVAVRTGQTVLVADAATGLITQKALVVASPYDHPVGWSGGDADIDVRPYDQATFVAGLNTVKCTMFVYGSDFGKGTESMKGAIQPNFTQFSNNPIILKDHFEINGSDTAQIGWVEVATEDGTSGYLWYLKSESETRLRFDDYLEMMMVESQLAGYDLKYDGNAAAGGIQVKGSEGLFSAIESRGNVYSGFSGAAAPGSGALADFDAILQQLDKQGAIEENMLFLNRSTALDFDDMIGAMAGGGYGSTASASYGLFDNEAEMALNFGFSGFRRGSYDFYKTDWKYLNDASTRGLSKAIDGVMIPAGTTTVYDQLMGVNIRRPFLHVRYRASETEDRRYKSWITGSVGGAYTSGLDAMSVHFLSERCLVTQAANNFVLFKAA